MASDFTKFASDENLPADNVTVIGRNSGFDDETTMDMETVHELRPSGPPRACSTWRRSPTPSSDADVFAQAITQSSGCAVPGLNHDAFRSRNMRDRLCRPSTIPIW